jgi:hypothetical protein
MRTNGGLDMKYGQELLDLINYAQSEATKDFGFAFSFRCNGFNEQKEDEIILLFMINPNISYFENTKNYIKISASDLRSKEYINWVNLKKEDFYKHKKTQQCETLNSIKKLKKQKNEIQEKIKALEGLFPDSQINRLVELL